MASYAVWSSRTFGVPSEGGVPNSSPSEPRPDLREGRGFDPVGAFSAPKAPPFGLGAAMVSGEAQSVFSCKKYYTFTEGARFQN